MTSSDLLPSAGIGEDAPRTKNTKAWIGAAIGIGFAVAATFVTMPLAATLTTAWLLKVAAAAGTGALIGSFFKDKNASAQKGKWRTMLGLGAAVASSLFFPSSLLTVGWFALASTAVLAGAGLDYARSGNSAPCALNTKTGALWGSAIGLGFAVAATALLGGFVAAMPLNALWLAGAAAVVGVGALVGSVVGARADSRCQQQARIAATPDLRRMPSGNNNIAFGPAPAFA